MSIEIISDCQCDATGCRARIHEGESCYCQSCYQELLDRIQELEKEKEGEGTWRQGGIDENDRNHPDRVGRVP